MSEFTLKKEILKARYMGKEGLEGCGENHLFASMKVKKNTSY